MDQKDFNQAVFSLHRYDIWANKMREHFFELVSIVAADPNKDRFSPQAIEADLYMSFWYGELYVVIEGWRELGLTDPAVDSLLESPNVDLLRRYRNGAFHFQKDYFDDRFVGFMRDGKDPASWVQDLNKALGAYFLHRRPEETSSSAMA